MPDFSARLRSLAVIGLGCKKKNPVNEAYSVFLVVVVERLKYPCVTCRKQFLHTNFHRAKNQMRTVCAQWIA